MKNKPLPPPHGYASNPEKGIFRSLVSPATFTGENSEATPAGIFPLVSVGEHVGKWSNRGFLPQIGERVHVRMNGLGTGRVVAYFLEGGYVGVEIACDNRPAWHKKQNGKRHPHPLVFGAEIARVAQS